MKKLLLTFLLLPKITIGETWDCVTDNKRFEHLFERNGNKIHLILNENNRKADYVMEIIKETDNYILANYDEVNEKNFSSHKFSFAKASQKYNFYSINFSDFISDDFIHGQYYGSCDVYEGKKIYPSK